MPNGARGPFETVESVVHAVSSISMLLEQTYSALISSVRSVYAVGEQVSRMKNQMGHLYAGMSQGLKIWGGQKSGGRSKDGAKIW